MAVPLHAPCGLPIFLPPGFTGPLCDCRALSRSSLTPAAAPSPAGTRALGSPDAKPDGAPLGRSEGTKDGGGGASQSASGSPGRGREERPQGSPKGPGGPIEAAAKPEGLDDAYKPDRDAQERAEGWFKSKFFKSKGIGDEWKKIVAACKTWGMPDKVKWRDWLKEQWDANRAVAVKVLITAGEIDSGFVKPANQGNPISRAILNALEADHATNEKGLTLDDLKAMAAHGATETHMADLLDHGFIYEPLPGRYRAIKGAK